MTVTAHITKCPKCDTTFRVTDAQLNVAKGAVRCGACLQVFRASDYFQEDKPAEITEPQDDRTQDMFDDEDALFNDDPSQDLADDDDDLLIQDDDEPSIELSDDFLSLNPEEVEDPFFSDSDKLKETVKETDDSGDESWAQALLDDNDFDEQPSHPQKTVKSKPLQAGFDPTSISTPSQGDKQKQFAYINDDPLDLTLPKKASKAKLLGLMSGCILLLVALILQALVFNFDSWARQDSYRPLYSLACEQIGCSLPSSYDVSKIQTTTSPQVSSHSDYENALMVDILFVNKADYPQAFPKIDLSFTNQTGKVIAHRLFMPSEYLAGEAAGLNLMPVDTPIHIGLEIQDPGATANSYRVRFVAP